MSLNQENIALGIDFGTTNSVIAIWDLKSNETRVLSNKIGQFSTKSLIGFKVYIKINI